MRCARPISQASSYSQTSQWPRFRSATREATCRPGSRGWSPSASAGTSGPAAHCSRTEALLFRLDPMRVYQHLVVRGHALPDCDGGRAARIALLERIDLPYPTREQYQPLGGGLLQLVHSYAHCTIRRLASLAGIERDGLAEYLLPHHLSFVVYGLPRRLCPGGSSGRLRDLAPSLPGRPRRGRIAMRAGPAVSKWRWRVHGVSAPRRALVPLVQPLPRPLRAIRDERLPIPGALRWTTPS